MADNMDHTAASRPQPAGRRTVRKLLLAAIVAALTLPLMLLLITVSSTPGKLGHQAGRLQPCPTSPNCVSTQADNPGQAMEPLPLNCDPQDAVARLKQIIEAQPRTKIVTTEAGYLHAEFTTAWLRFTDDVEFLVDQQASQIHFRSASRVGHSDLGANRRRMEKLTAAYLERE